MIAPFSGPPVLLAKPLDARASRVPEIRPCREGGKQIMAHDVFISYATEDKRIADAVCAAIETRGFRCWMAPRDVRAGMSYGEFVTKGILRCRVMVLVFSANANAQSHIPKELKRAVAHVLAIIP